jgi:hypothetical protein
VFRHWRFTVLEKLLNVEEIPKIMAFCEHVMGRQIALFEEYKETFPNIYKDRVKQYIKPATNQVVPETRLCKSTESPRKDYHLGDEDVEMMEDSPIIPSYAQTYDERHRMGSGAMMLIQ